MRLNRTDDAPGKAVLTRSSGVVCPCSKHTPPRRPCTFPCPSPLIVPAIAGARGWWGGLRVQGAARTVRPYGARSPTLPAFFSDKNARTHAARRRHHHHEEQQQELVEEQRRGVPLVLGLPARVASICSRF